MTKTSAEKFADIIQHGHKKYGAKFRTKRNWNSFWRFLNSIRNVLFFNPPEDFVNDVITTIGPYIFFTADFKPEKATDRDVAIYAHELEHVRQYKLCGLGSAWLGTLPFLLLYLFLPFPVFFAWFRYYFERNAFRAEAHYAYTHGLRVVIDIPRITKHITGKMYFFAWYSKKQVYNWLKLNALPGPVDASKLQ